MLKPFGRWQLRADCGLWADLLLDLMYLDRESPSSRQRSGLPTPNRVECLG